MRTAFPSLASIGAVALATLAGCPKPSDFVECVDDTSCRRAVDGKCLVNADTGHQFCAYPDQSCPDGFRWSDLDVEDSISGTCVAGGPDAGVPDAPTDAPDGGPVNGWSQVFGAGGYDYANDVAVDGSGNVYVVGSFTGSVNFAGETLTSAGGSDVFVVKLDGNGNRVWARRYGGIGEDSALSVAATSSGIVVAGQFIGTVDFGAGAVAALGASDGFLLSLTNAGAFGWTVRLGGTDVDSIKDVTIDSQGNVIVLGQFQGTAAFGGSQFTSAGFFDAAVAKFTSAGVYAWSRQLGGVGSDFPAGVAVLQGDDVVVASTFSQSVDLGGGTLTSAGANDLWLARITSAAGAHVWSRRYGSTNQDSAKGIAATADGFVLVGCFMQTADFGGGTRTSAGMSDAVVARYDLAGAHLWSQSIGGAAGDCAVTASVTGAGNVLAAGFFNGSVTVGSTNITSLGNEDVMTVELAAASGSPLAVRRAGGTGSDLPTSVASVGQEFVLVGSVTDMSNMFGHVISGGGMSDGFVVRTQR